MRKSHDHKPLIAAGQTDMQRRQDDRYGLGTKTELSGLGSQRHEMEHTQSQIAEMQGTHAEELPGQV